MRGLSLNIRHSLSKSFNKRNVMLFFIYVLGLAVAACLAVYLMWGVYSIPVSKMRNNMGNAVEKLVLFMEYVPYSFDGLVIDSYTDSLMLNNASFWVQNPFYDSLMNPRVEYPVAGHEESLYIALQKSDLLGANIFEYPRFWHGYLLFLKPLLVFFDLQEIRYINLMYQVGMLFIILYLLYKKLGFGCCVAFGAAVCFLNPVTSWICLEYIADVNVMLFAMLWVLINKNPDNRYIFFVIGVITILFDFLTFPLVTLGIPLIVYICLYERGFKDNVSCVVGNSLLWLFGYAGMWFSKWSLATLLTGENVFQRVKEKIYERTYGDIFVENEPVTVLIANAIKFNVNIVCNYTFLLCIVAALLLIFLNYRLRCERKMFFNLKAVILLGISLMPFTWYVLLANHSIHHPQFTYRLFAITVYAVLSAIVCCMKQRKAR